MVELPHQIEGALLHQLDLHGDVVNLMNVDGQKDLEHLKKMDNSFGFENISVHFWKYIVHWELYIYASLIIINNVG